VRAALTLFLSLCVASATVRAEGVGQAPSSWDQKLCAPEPLHPCTEGVLQGGWSVTILFDQPGVSVMNKVAFVEDSFSAGALLVDVAAIWLLPFGGFRLWARRGPSRAR